MHYLLWLLGIVLNTCICPHFCRVINEAGDLLTAATFHQFVFRMINAFVYFLCVYSIYLTLAFFVPFLHFLEFTFFTLMLITFDLLHEN